MEMGAKDSGQGLRSWDCAQVHAIERAPHAAAAAVQDVSVDHRRGHVAVTEEFLDGPYVVASLEEVRGEGVPERVARGGLREAADPHGDGELSLHHALVDVVSAAARPDAGSS